MDDLLDLNKRRVISSKDAALQPYNRYGEPLPGLTWLPLNKAADGSFETFIIRFAPGASSQPHEHTGFEEFMVLDGELADCDGRLFKTGDYVSFEPGSKHYSVAPSGCTLLVFLHGGSNRPLS